MRPACVAVTNVAAAACCCCCCYFCCDSPVETDKHNHWSIPGDSVTCLGHVSAKHQGQRVQGGGSGLQGQGGGTGWGVEGLRSGSRSGVTGRVGWGPGSWVRDRVLGSGGSKPGVERKVSAITTKATTPPGDSDRGYSMVGSGSRVRVAGVESQGSSPRGGAPCHHDKDKDDT